MEQNQNYYPNIKKTPNPLFNKYSNLGGWLLFFVVMNIIAVVIGVIGILAILPDYLDMVSELSASGDPNHGTPFLLLFISGIVQLIIVTIATIMIFRRQRGFLTIIFFDAFLSILAVIFGFVLSSMYPWYTSGGDIPNAIYSITINILVVVYFVKSVRVRTYMGSDEYITKGMFTSGITPPQPVEPYTISFSSGYSSGYSSSNNIGADSRSVPDPASTPTQATAPAKTQTPDPTTAPISEPAATLPAGWYKDPASPESVCWWDGQRWQPESRRSL